jgi:hypothetical protein
MSSPFYEVGRYACKVIDQALGEAGTGNPQFVLRFQVMGLVDPADPSAFIPARGQYERTHYRTITEKTISYFMDDLKALGFAGSSFRDLDPKSEGFHDFRGQDVDMWCAHEPDQKGGTREKWGVARQAGALEVKPLEPKKLRDLDNLFGKQLKAIKAEPKPTPVAVSAGGGSEALDEDTPF